MGLKAYDIFSWSHFIGGIILYKFGLNWWISNLIHLGYEFTDDLIYPQTFREFKDTPDTLINSVSDQVFMNIGYLIAPYIFPKIKFNQKYIYLLLIMPIFGSAAFVNLKRILNKNN